MNILIAFRIWPNSQPSKQTLDKEDKQKTKDEKKEKDSIDDKVSVN